MTRRRPARWRWANKRKDRRELWRGPDLLAWVERYEIVSGRYRWEWSATTRDGIEYGGTRENRWMAEVAAQTKAEQLGL